MIHRGENRNRLAFLTGAVVPDCSVLEIGECFTESAANKMQVIHELLEIPALLRAGPARVSFRGASGLSQRTSSRLIGE